MPSLGRRGCLRFGDLVRPPPPLIPLMAQLALTPALLGRDYHIGLLGGRSACTYNAPDIRPWCALWQLSARVALLWQGSYCISCGRHDRNRFHKPFVMRSDEFGHQCLDRLELHA